jgi:wyosine [tRNA(Phe)-imidazoG37] synthetase (radical SAM superfamily)
MAVRPFPGEEGETYMELLDHAYALHVEVQTVTHPSRVHLDIEADDIEAEVRRLEQLGARRLGPVESWYVMQAPTGQRFCVVQVQRADFATRANTWNDDAT